MPEKPFINLNNETGYGSRLKKPIIITLVVIVVMVVAAILVVVLTPKTNPSDKKDNTPAYDKTASFTKMQKLFTQLCGKEIVVEFIAEQYFKKNGDYDVSTFANHTGQISLKGTDEYIVFDVINEEEDSPDMAVNFAYHQTINEKDTFVIQSGENTYQHYNGAITNEFDNIEDAILDHQLFQ